MTLFPVEVDEPFSRLDKKLDRKDWSAAVPFAVVEEVVDEDVVGEVDVDADEDDEDEDDEDEDEDEDADEGDDADDDPLVLDVPDVVPPRSAISLENAVFSAVKLLDEMVEGAPSAVEVAPMSWLLPKSLMSDVIAAPSRDRS